LANGSCSQGKPLAVMKARQRADRLGRRADPGRGRLSGGHPRGDPALRPGLAGGASGDPGLGAAKGVDRHHCGRSRVHRPRPGRPLRRERRRPPWRRTRSRRRGRGQRVCLAPVQPRGPTRSWASVRPSPRCEAGRRKQHDHRNARQEERLSQLGATARPGPGAARAHARLRWPRRQDLMAPGAARSAAGPQAQRDARRRRERDQGPESGSAARTEAKGAVQPTMPPCARTISSVASLKAAK